MLRLGGGAAALWGMYVLSGKHMFVPKNVASAAALCYVEEKFLRRWCRWLYRRAGADSPFPNATRAYALVWLVNAFSSTFVLLILGMKVGQARRKYDVQLPQMYAVGDSESAVAFNSVQRGHQQAFETYTSFAVLSLIGGLRHPVSVAVAGIMWGVGRLRYAAGYAAGGPKWRMSLSGSRWVWWSLLAVATASVSAIAQQLCGSGVQNEDDTGDRDTRKVLATALTEL